MTKQDAMSRVAELMAMPMNAAPPKALAYAQYLAKLYGGCGEVFVTAYAHYAQAVERLECKDEGYKIDEQGKDFFKANND